MQLETIAMPVSDVDRAIAFCDELGFTKATDVSHRDRSRREVENSLPQQGNLASFCRCSMLEFTHDSNHPAPISRSLDSAA